MTPFIYTNWELEMNFIKNLFNKNKKIIFYFSCSVLSAGFEAGLLLVFKNIVPSFDKNIVYANTAATIISSILHYTLTSKFVFKVKMNWMSAVVYLITFFIGLGIQNGVIWCTYNKLLPQFISNDNLLTLSSKVISLAASFFITYFIRKKLNLILKQHEEEKIK